jgi:hypothetical protein
MTSYVFARLDQATAVSEAEFYRDSGASAQYVSDGPGTTTFTLTVTYPDAPAPTPAPASAPDPATVVPKPTQMGYVLAIQRIRCELRASMSYPRTVGIYQAFQDGVPIAGISGYCVERQGPGDNTQSGVANHRRIAAGSYRLFTQDDGGKFKTIGYANPGGPEVLPYPCVRVDGTGARSGILFHPGAGYTWSTGCINPTDFVADASTNLDFNVSWNRVVGLIDSLAGNIVGFPTTNNTIIPTCTLVITGEPDLQLSAPVAAVATAAVAAAVAVAAAGPAAAAAPAAAAVAAAAPPPVSDGKGDPTADLKAAIRLGVCTNEIPTLADAYKLSFAGKGNSGASFGVTQGDLAAGQPIVQSTFRSALANAGFLDSDIQTFDGELSVHLLSNPLSAADTQRINAALLNSKNLVDQMDEDILSEVYAGVDQCIAAASSAGRHIEPIALIYMALWINMTGPPTRLLAWLKGGDPGLTAPTPPLSGSVAEDDIQTYLRLTSYFTSNPGNLQHMITSAQAGGHLLQQNAAIA